MKYRQFYVYILTNFTNKVLYTGFSSDLHVRDYKHKNKVYLNSFTAKYNVNKLVYYEVADTAEAGIVREKQIKAGSRKKKIELIESLNPEWKDLSKEINE